MDASFGKLLVALVMTVGWRRLCNDGMVLRVFETTPSARLLNAPTFSDGIKCSSLAARIWEPQLSSNGHGLLRVTQIMAVRSCFVQLKMYMRSFIGSSINVFRWTIRFRSEVIGCCSSPSCVQWRFLGSQWVLPLANNWLQL